MFIHSHRNRLKTVTPPFSNLQTECVCILIQNLNVTYLVRVRQRNHVGNSLDGLSSVSM